MVLVPDDIILAVLDEVPSLTKMRWSFLARRFNRLWMLSNHLKIDMEDFTGWDHYCGFLDDLLTRTNGGLALTALTIKWPAALRWAPLSSVVRLETLVTHFLSLPFASELSISLPRSQEPTFIPRASSLFTPVNNVSVKKISITNMVIDREGFFGGFQRLNSLNLEGVLIDYGLDPFGGCPVLEKLTLVKCTFKGDVVNNAIVKKISIKNMFVNRKGFFAGFQRLNSLDLEGVVIDSGRDPFGACILLEKLTLIKCAFKGDVEIRGKGMRVLTIRCPRTSPSFSTTVLTPRLSCLEFESPGIARFSFPAPMPMLEYLRIRGRRFEQLESILGHAQILEILDLTWKTITWAVHNHIRVRLPNLRILRIYGSGNQWIPSKFLAKCAGANDVSIQFYSGNS